MMGFLRRSAVWHGACLYVKPNNERALQKGRHDSASRLSELACQKELAMKRIVFAFALLAALVFGASPALAHSHHGYHGGYGHHGGGFGYGGWGGNYGWGGSPFYGRGFGYPGVGYGYGYGYPAYGFGYGYPGYYGPQMGGYYNGLNFGF